MTLRKAALLFSITIGTFPAFCQTSQKDSVTVKKDDLLGVIKLAQDGLSCDSLVTDYKLTIQSAQAVLLAQDSVNSQQAKTIGLLKSQIAEQQGIQTDQKELLKQEKKKTWKFRLIALGAIILAGVEFLAAQ